MVDPRHDPIGWLMEQQTSQEPVSQLDRVERLLLRLLAEIQIARFDPLSACKARPMAAQTTSARGFFPPPTDAAGESQKTSPVPRCNESPRKAQAGSES